VCPKCTVSFVRRLRNAAGICVLEVLSSSASRPHPRRSSSTSLVHSLLSQSHACHRPHYASSRLDQSHCGPPAWRHLQPCLHRRGWPASRMATVTGIMHMRCATFLSSTNLQCKISYKRPRLESHFSTNSRCQNDKTAEGPEPKTEAWYQIQLGRKAKTVPLLSTAWFDKPDADAC
jgi:hypothetical protein